MGITLIKNKMGISNLSEIRKGESLIACMRENFKNEFVTATQIRGTCPRGGDYTREVLNEAAKYGIIERKVEMHPVTKYYIDPVDDIVICPYEPGKPYEQSICYKIEKIIEERAELRSKLQNIYQ